MVPRTRQASHGIGAVWRVVDALPGPQPAPGPGPRCLCSLGATARLTPFFAATAGSGMHVWSLSTREGGARVLTTAVATCIERHALPHPLLALLPVDAELIGVAANGAVERFAYARAPSTPVDRTHQQLKLAIMSGLEIASDPKAQPPSPRAPATADDLPPHLKAQLEATSPQLDLTRERANRARERLRAASIGQEPPQGPAIDEAEATAPTGAPSPHVAHRPGRRRVRRRRKKDDDPYDDPYDDYYASQYPSPSGTLEGPQSELAGSVVTAGAIRELEAFLSSAPLQRTVQSTTQNPEAPTGPSRPPSRPPSPTKKPVLPDAKSICGATSSSFGSERWRQRMADCTASGGNDGDLPVDEEPLPAWRVWAPKLKPAPAPVRAAPALDDAQVGDARVDDLSDSEELPLPGGFHVGDKPFFVGASQPMPEGKLLQHGSQGEVKGPATLPSHKGKGVALLFPGHDEPVDCHVSDLRHNRRPKAASLQPPQASIKRHHGNAFEYPVEYMRAASTPLWRAPIAPTPPEERDWLSPMPYTPPPPPGAEASRPEQRDWLRPFQLPRAPSRARVDVSEEPAPPEPEASAPGPSRPESPSSEPYSYRI